MRGKVAIFCATAISLIMASCDKIFNPVSPTSPITDSGFSKLESWSPCIIVQTPGFNGSPELENQMRLAEELQKAGRATWVRFGNASVNGNGLDYFNRARSKGFKVFGIIKLADLERYGWEYTFDSIYQRFPADIWEIA